MTLKRSLKKKCFSLHIPQKQCLKCRITRHDYTAFYSLLVNTNNFMFINYWSLKMYVRRETYEQLVKSKYCRKSRFTQFPMFYELYTYTYNSLVHVFGRVASNFLWFPSLYGSIPLSLNAKPPPTSSM